MRWLAVVGLLALASSAPAQTEAVVKQVEARLSTLKFLAAREDPAGGFKLEPKGPTSLRATSAAIRAWKHLADPSSPLPHKDEHIAFVLSCYDNTTGGFADKPGGTQDVTLTSVGVMAAMELGIAKRRIRRSMDFLSTNAATFEDVRIGAAAVEAWGVEDCPFSTKPWFSVANEFGRQKALDPKDGGARNTGSLVAFTLRLSRQIPEGAKPQQILDEGQLEDGGWKKAGADGSDLETCYRVMRAYYLMKAKPAKVDKLRSFLSKCRNADAGYGTKPGEPSSISGIYYATMIEHWLGKAE